MKMFSDNIVFVVRDNLLGSYFLDLGYFLKSANEGFSYQYSTDFVSHKTFTNIKDMMDYMKLFEQEEFNFTMAIDPFTPDHIMDKYFKDSENI
jgi:hypothetical protein